MMRFAIVLLCLVGVVHAQNHPDPKGPKASAHSNLHVTREKCPDPLIMRKKDGAQYCARPTITNRGTCPYPYILKGEYPYTLLQAKHWELRSLSWDEMVHEDKEDVREFLRTHDVPFSVRTKVLDLHDTDGGDKECVPAPPQCLDPLVYDETAAACVPPKPTMVSPIIDDSYVQPVMKDFEEDGSEDTSGPSRIHQEVLTDENDKVLQEDRHDDEEDIWDFEVNRVATASG